MADEFYRVYGPTMYEYIRSTLNLRKLIVTLVYFRSVMFNLTPVTPEDYLSLRFIEETGKCRSPTLAFSTSDNIKRDFSCSRDFFYTEDF